MGRERVRRQGEVSAEVRRRAAAGQAPPVSRGGCRDTPTALPPACVCLLSLTHFHSMAPGAPSGEEEEGCEIGCWRFKI